FSLCGKAQRTHCALAQQRWRTRQPRVLRSHSRDNAAPGPWHASCIVAACNHFNKKGRFYMKLPRTISAWIAAFWIMAGFALAGCESQGPFEEAGEEIDQAADEVEDEIDQAL